MSSVSKPALIFHQTSTSVVVGLFGISPHPFDTKLLRNFTSADVKTMADVAGRLPAEALREGWERTGNASACSLLGRAESPHRDASKELIPCLDAVLTEANISLPEVAYIGCTIGPAPFTTLRTLVVTVNGLGFGTGIPLVGVNGLVCLAQEAHKSHYQRTYAINSAFGSDVYCAVYDPAEQYIDCQVMSLVDCLGAIASYNHQFPQAKIQIVGNVISLHKHLIEEKGIVFDTPELVESHASLEAIAAAAHVAWLTGPATSELKPYYGKSAW